LAGEIIVLKFGSSVLGTPADLPNAVHEIYRWYRGGYRVIAVVSAIGLATDELLCEAQSVTATPEPYATAELLSTGERTSAALLGLALDRSGIRARVVDPRELRLIASGSALDSELCSLNYGRVHDLLADYPVLVLPGFFGADTEGRTLLLGRGGSDLTAIFLARTLKARCRLLKDVDGVYEIDPTPGESAARDPDPRRYAYLSYADALRVATQLLQPKAVAFARQYTARAEVASCGQGYETVVHGGSSEFAGVPSPAVAPTVPSRVLMLGLGTVGLGVYQRLLANPGDFQVVGALVRDRGKYERLGLPAGILRTRSDQIAKLRADIVVDALSDADLSRELAEHYLSSGASFVSAGKRLIAESGPSLDALAERSGGTLLYRAAVGGATPMLEAIEHCSAREPITALAGVLNGTCNFVLDRCRDGASFSEAVQQAQQLGLAEADPTDDMGGNDAAWKLSILCRHAFHTEARVVERQALDESAAARAREMAPKGLRLRQIARASLCDGEVRATVRLETVPQDSPFGQLRDEWTALQLVTQDGLELVKGRGAGRWPTTEAVIADLFDLRRLAAVSDASRRSECSAPARSSPRSG